MKDSGGIGGNLLSRFLYILYEIRAVWNIKHFCKSFDYVSQHRMLYWSFKKKASINFYRWGCQHWVAEQCVQEENK